MIKMIGQSNRFFFIVEVLLRYTFEINNCKTVHFGELLQLKHPNLRIFKGFCNMNLRIFNIIRIFALRKYLTPFV